MRAHIQKDTKAITNNMKNLPPDKIKDNISAYRDIFLTDYEQLIIKEKKESQLLKKMLKCIYYLKKQNMIWSNGFATRH